MYPDWAFVEFYPLEVVRKVLREHPNASIEEKHRLMRAENGEKEPQPSSLVRHIENDIKLFKIAFGL